MNHRFQQFHRNGEWKIRNDGDQNRLTYMSKIGEILILTSYFDYNYLLNVVESTYSGSA